MSSPQSSTSDYLYALSNRGEYGELVKYVRYHDNESVRYGAAGILSESAHGFKNHATPQMRQLLIDTVLNDPSDAVRAHVIELLLTMNEEIIDNIITRLEVNPVETPVDYPYPLVLTKWCSSNRPGLRYLAAAGFGSTASQTAVTKLRKLLIEDEHPRVLSRAMNEASTVGDETFVTPIQSYLRNDPEDLDKIGTQSDIQRVKRASVEALIGIGTDAAYEALISASRSSNEEIKQYAISEIGRFGAEDTLELIIDELHTDSTAPVREEAAEGLLTAISESGFEESHDVRRDAIQTLGDDVSKDVCSEFASIVETGERISQKRNAAWLLGELQESNEEVITTLLASLTARDEYLQKVASASLLQLDDTAVLEHVDDFLSRVDADSDAHQLASFVQANVVDESKKAKQEVIEYSYITDPDEYTSPN